MPYDAPLAYVIRRIAAARARGDLPETKFEQPYESTSVFLDSDRDPFLFGEVERAIRRGDRTDRHEVVFDVWNSRNSGGPRSVRVGLDDPEELQLDTIGTVALARSIGRGHLNSDEEQALEHLGWRRPPAESPGGSWCRTIAREPMGPRLASALIARTLIDVHHWMPHKALLVSLSTERRREFAD